MLSHLDFIYVNKEFHLSQQHHTPVSNYLFNQEYVKSLTIVTEKHLQQQPNHFFFEVGLVLQVFVSPRYFNDKLKLLLNFFLSCISSGS